METYHNLKTWSCYYQRVVNGTKTFEVRKNDRDFQTGDILVLEEYNPETKEYSGYRAKFNVTYILHGGEFGIEPGHVVMGIKPHAED